MDPEGNTYERRNIESWLHKNATSPITRSPLALKDLVPNRALVIYFRITLECRINTINSEKRLRRIRRQERKSIPHHLLYYDSWAKEEFLLM